MSKVHYSPEAPATVKAVARGTSQYLPFCGVGTQVRIRMYNVTSNRELVTCTKCAAEGKMDSVDSFIESLTDTKSTSYQQSGEFLVADNRPVYREETIQEQVDREVREGKIRPFFG